jgi:hypothetical protein
MAGSGGRKRLRAEQSAQLIECGSDVNIEMCIHTSNDGTGYLYDGHGHPFSPQMVKGWLAVP